MDKKEHHSLQKHSAGMFGGFRLACGAVLSIVIFTLIGCLDIPDEPQTAQEVESVSLYILQDGQQDSSLLKIRPGDSAILAAQVYPRQYKKDLTHNWIRRTTIGDTLLGTDETYTLPAQAKDSTLPNLLILKDKVGNTREYPFSIIVNTPPALSDETTPAEGDTLYGTANTTILFKWLSFDTDNEDFGKLTHTLIIDGTRASIGSINEIRQSGLAEGSHTFRVIVYDSYGDADSLPEITFYMIDSLRGLR